MTEHLGTQLLSLDEWDVELLRFTVFLAPAAQLAPKDLWQKVVGEPPEEIREQLKTGTINLSGMFADDILTLTVRPNRVDWQYQGNPELVSQPGLPVIQNFEGALSRFVELMNRWLSSDSFPTVTRIALGSVLRHEVEDRLEGYRFMQSYVKSVKLEPETSRDFVYQINRPRGSKVISELVINRLSKWLVGVVRRAEMTIQHPAPKTFDESYNGRIELDINTDAEFTGEFDSLAAINLLQEIGELTREMVREGDIP
jgi:hypothetical protein